MATNVSDFKSAYRTPVESKFPTERITIFIGGKAHNFKPVSTSLRYGTNPNQSFNAYFPEKSSAYDAPIGNLEMLKGGKAGLSLTNLQDISQAFNILKYFSEPACTIMKHLNPCGFKVRTKGESLSEIYRAARDCDKRSAFGGVVSFIGSVDKYTAQDIMESFTEVVVATSYHPEALEILSSGKKINKEIRLIQVANQTQSPKFIGDDLNGYFNIRTLADGTLTLETPFLTRIKSSADFITDPMIPNTDPARNNGQDYVATARPTEQQLADALTSWYLNINTRSNGVVFVKDGMALAVGTGEQERIGAVEKAIDKAKKKGHNLEGAVMSSDGFFPSRDCIDAVAAEGVKAVVWPAGSMNDAEVIDAANQHGIAMLATLERCFAHF